MLRAGEPLPISGHPAASGYRILVSRGWTRPKARLYTYGVQAPIPTIPIPLTPNEDEPQLELNQIVHDLHDRARFDLRLHYDRPPEPALEETDLAWAQAQVEQGK